MQTYLRAGKVRKFGVGLGASMLFASLSIVPGSAAVKAQAPASPPPIPCCGGGGPVWGVDTTTTIGSSFLTTIKSHVGTPVIVGQYLDTGAGNT